MANYGIWQRRSNSQKNEVFAFCKHFVTQIIQYGNLFNYFIKFKDRAKIHNSG